MITVFYDGKCTVCAREIRYYQRIAPGGVFVWQDIAHAPEVFEALGYAQADGLKILHAEDTRGTMHTGVDAFILIWRQLPGWRYLAPLAAQWPFKPLLQRGYAWFARAASPGCRIVGPPMILAPGPANDAPASLLAGWCGTVALPLRTAAADIRVYRRAIAINGRVAVVLTPPLGGSQIRASGFGGG